MKTEQEFLDQFRHEWGGMILDALDARNGPALSTFTRQILRKVDAQIVKMYRALAQPAPLANGTNKPAEKPAAARP